MLGAGNRVARHQMNAGGQFRLDVPDDHLLDRAHICDDCTRGKVRRHRGSGRPVDAHRNGQDNQVGAGDRVANLCVGAIDDHQFFRRRARVGVRVVSGDMARQAVRLEGARQRRPDQADADDRHTIE